MSDTIYFRPAQAQPYHLIRASNWLVRIKKFKNSTDAYNFLIDLEIHRPDLFRYYMSEYHRVHSFKTGYLVQTSDIKAFRSAIGPYGEDSHMYYSRK